MQTQNITLDFCRNDYKTVTIKQYDADSRHVLITCTDNGSVYRLDSSTHTCNVKMMTPDNRAIWDNQCISITEDGKVLITFSENMVLANGTGKLEIQVIENATSRELSTMILTVVIVGSVYSNDTIIASDEFNILKDTMDKATSDYTHVMESAQASANIAKASEENASASAAAASESANRAQECADTIDTSVIEAKLITKGDNLFYDENTHLLYLTSDGQIVGDGVQVASGTGGGNGSGSDDVAVRLTNQNGTASLVNAYGNAITLLFTFTSIENDLPTGDGNCRITVNGVTKVNMSISQGLNAIDVAPYLNIGFNTVIVNCTDVYGVSKSLSYSVTVVQLNIESTFNAAVPYDGDIIFKYTPYGSVEKTIHFIVDQEEIGTTVTSLTGKQMTRTIPKMSHGAHRLEVYSTATLNDAEISSPKLIYDVICLESGDTTPIIASVYNKESVAQGEQVSIPYIVYDPSKLSCDITLTVYTIEEDETVVYATQDITVDRNQWHWNTRKYPIGDVYFKIQYGDIYVIHEVNVVENELDINVETNDLELSLSSDGRSNNETNPAKWTYGDVTTTFENMNWDSVGWINDEEGDACLRLNGDARAEINFKPFAEDIRTYGKTIELEFVIRDVNNRDAVPISCMSGGLGFEVKADTAYLVSEQSKVFCNYKEEEKVHLAFVIESKDEYRMLSIYLNGVLSDAIQYPTTDNFQQKTPVNISIGSPYCGVDLYKVRSYSTALTHSTATTNFIADITDVVRKTEVYEDNDIYDEFGAISFQKAKEKNSVMVIVGNLPQSKGDKKQVAIHYYDVEDANLNFNEDDVTIDVQGTSSQW